MRPGPDLKTTYLSKVLCVIKRGAPRGEVHRRTHPDNGSCVLQQPVVATFFGPRRWLTSKFSILEVCYFVVLLYR